MLLVYREAQVEKLQLPIVTIQKIPPRGAVLAGSPHILPQPVERGAFLSISFGVIAVRVLDVRL